MDDDTRQEADDTDVSASLVFDLKEMLKTDPDLSSLSNIQIKEEDFEGPTGPSSSTSAVGSRNNNDCFISLDSANVSFASYDGGCGDSGAGGAVFQAVKVDAPTTCGGNGEPRFIQLDSQESGMGSNTPMVTSADDSPIVLQTLSSASDSFESSKSAGKRSQFASMSSICDHQQPQSTVLWHAPMPIATSSPVSVGHNSLANLGSVQSRTRNVTRPTIPTMSAGYSFANSLPGSPPMPDERRPTYQLPYLTRLIENECLPIAQTSSSSFLSQSAPFSDSGFWPSDNQANVPATPTPSTVTTVQYRQASESPSSSIWLRHRQPRTHFNSIGSASSVGVHSPPPGQQFSGAMASTAGTLVIADVRSGIRDSSSPLLDDIGEILDSGLSPSDLPDILSDDEYPEAQHRSPTFGGLRANVKPKSDDMSDDEDYDLRLDSVVDYSRLASPAGQLASSVPVQHMHVRKQQAQQQDQEDYSTFANGGGKAVSKAKFWDYNVQAKGPKTQKYVVPELFTDSTFNFVDPVFSEAAGHVNVKHSGKARRGEGNDLTSDPIRLAQIGRSLDKWNQIITELSMASNADNVSPAFKSKSRREKNMLASRACRLKKKAQFEANKLIFSGLKSEEDRMKVLIAEAKRLAFNKLALINSNKSIQGDKDEQLSLTRELDNMWRQALDMQVSGHTSAYVSSQIEPYLK